MGTEQEIIFAKTLEKVRKSAKEQGNYITEEAVKEAFAQLQLTKEQLELVLDYLKKHKIGIGAPAEPEEFLSEEEMDYLEAYQKQLSLIEKVSDGEKEAITLQAMAGESGARERLIRLYLPQVAEISRLYAGQGVLLEDLIGEGNVALSVGAAMLGCLSQASEAEGMLMKMVMDAMEERITERLQETDQDQKLAQRVNQVADQARELSEELHRKVTPEELAEESGMSAEFIRDTMRISGFAIEDLEQED